MCRDTVRMTAASTKKNANRFMNASLSERVIQNAKFKNAQLLVCFAAFSIAREMVRMLRIA